MVRLERSLHGDVVEIARHLESHVEADGWSLAVVEKCRMRMPGASVYVYVYAKYFPRFGDRATLTLVVAEHAEHVGVLAIASSMCTEDHTGFRAREEHNLIAIVTHALEALQAAPE